MSNRRTRPSKTSPGFMPTQKISQFPNKELWRWKKILLEKPQLSFHTLQAELWSLDLAQLQCPTLGSSFVCTWSIGIFPESVDSQASVVLIGQPVAVIIIKRWCAVSVLETLSAHGHRLKLQRTTITDHRITISLVWTANCNAYTQCL